MIEFASTRMSLDSQRYPAGKPLAVKHCFLCGSAGQGVELSPHLYFEAKIDFADVRSGVRQTCGISNAVDILPLDSDFLWTEDMVRSVDPSCVQIGIPDHPVLRPLPEFVDADVLAQAETQFIHYLLRYFKLLIYRNFALNLYSIPGESLAEFTARCVDMLGEPFRLDLDKLREVFDRELEQAKGKYFRLKEQGEFDFPLYPIQFKSILHEVSERIAQMFVSTELTLNPVSDDLLPQKREMPELEERLSSLEMEAHNSVSRLLSVYQEKARNIDEYIVRPNLKDIHLVRSCILWMPSGGPSR